MVRPFDFKLLDDLMLVEPGQVATVLPRLVGLAADVIGPLVEYTYLQSQEGSPLPPVGQLCPSAVASRLMTAMSAPAVTSTSLKAADFEFTRLPSERTASPTWRAFCQRLGDAARLAGFEPSLSKGMSAGFREMAENVYEHSDAYTSAVAGYRWTPGIFEFVVADRGIGVLNSLRRSGDYTNLHDHGKALHVALSPGESRFGRLVGRGNGFDTLFRSLAKQSGSLRFRSGDHGLEVDGTSPSLVHARLRQRRFFTGFLVSVVCRP